MSVSGSLVNIRYYIASDTYYYATCNRPLTDLTTNVASLAYYLDLINEGFQATVCTDLGSGGALNPTTSQFPAVPDLPVGTTITFAVVQGNSGAATVSLNSSPPTALVSESGPLQGGELVAGTWVILAWTGMEWLLVAKEAGSFPVAPGQSPSQPVILGQLQNDSMSLSFSSVSLESLSGTTLTAQEITVPAGASSPNAVNFSQLGAGLATSQSTINWTDVTSDEPLQVGQTAYYAPTGQLSSLPLHIACGDNQIYEMDVYQLPPYSGFTVGIGLDISLLPNNTSYSGAFEWAAMENEASNQGEFYEAPSTTATYGIAAEMTTDSSNFYMDDVGGSAIPPYHRHIKLYTGSTSLGVPKVLSHIGGGGNTPAAAGSNSTTGTNITGGVWNDTTTAYSSLGTITTSLEYPTPLTCIWVVFVRRIF